MSADPVVLALNGGSSSLKYALFRAGGGQETLLAKGEALAKASARGASTLEALLRELDAKGLPKPDGVGHRIVHGGPHHLLPARVDAHVRAELARAIPFAPLHLPAELALIDAVSKQLPDTPQIACFDTGFHRTLPEIAQRFALPERYFKAGIHRYGFHGLSYEFIVSSLGPKALGRAVIAHLGSGSSLCAVRDGESIDTTMAFTPTAGLVMSTRCGDLDPGVLIYLIEQERLDAKKLEQLLNHESGLLALSRSTGDIKKLEQQRTTDPRAALALEVFCQSIRKHLGAMAAALGGLDSLVFTGGAGAASSFLRAEVCRPLGFLGLELDEAQNQAGARVISSRASRCRVHALHTDEERMIARHCARLI